MVLDNQGDQQVTAQAAEHSEKLHDNAEPRITNDTVANSWGTHENIRNRLHGNLLHASTVMSTIKAMAVKFCTFLRSRANLQLFLVIAFSIILLLMQVQY